MRILIILLSFSFSVPAFSQTGSIKVHKQFNDQLTFALFEKAMDANPDSLLHLFSAFGFKVDSVKQKNYSKNCVSDINELKKEEFLKCLFFRTDSLELHITYSKFGKVFYIQLLPINNMVNKKLGERLYRESLGRKYKKQPESRYLNSLYRFTSKGERNASLYTDGENWNFTLADESVVK